MAKKPESVLRALLGDRATKVIVDGHEVDATAEVAIPKDADLPEILQDHAETVAMWERVVARLKNKVAKLEDAFEELHANRFVQYWQELEDRERKELKEHMHDEDELADDQGDRKRAFKRVARRVTSGVDTGRWRRNFTDDLIRGHVNSDSDVVTSKKTLRLARYELNQAIGVVKSLNHRQTTLNHLAALYRDTSRQ